MWCANPIDLTTDRMIFGKRLQLDPRELRFDRVMG